MYIKIYRFTDIKDHRQTRDAGFASAFFLIYGLVIFLVYLVYEVREKEAPVATVGGVVEFLVGYVVGLAFLVWLALGFYT